MQGAQKDKARAGHLSEISCEISNKLKLSPLPEALQAQILEELTLENPKWLENVRMGRRNYRVPRVLKYYTLRKNGGVILPRGYGERLAFLCAQYGQTLHYTDKRRTLPAVEFTFSGSLRPYQEQACQTMLRRRFGTLCAPTGAGKTVCGLFLVAARRQPTLILVHTRELAAQWVERIETFLGIAARDVGMIGGGKNRVGEAVTVATVQSVYSRAAALRKHIGHVVIDECHRAPSRMFTAAVSQFDSAYALGLSATPWRRDGLTPLIFWHVGPVHAEVDRQALMDGGALLRPEIILHCTAFTSQRDPVEEYSGLMTDLTEDQERNRRIVQTLAQNLPASGACLVLSDRRAHCRVLQELLEQMYGVKGALLTGDLSATVRRETVAALHAGQVRVVFATGQLVGEGFDAKGLSALFLTTPVKFSGRLIQYLGRILRPGDAGKKAWVHDFVDSQVPVLLASARSRLDVYSELGAQVPSLENVLPSCS